MSTAEFMTDALQYNVYFALGEGGVVEMTAPDSIWGDKEVIALIRKHKLEIQNQLEQGFDCVRDSITVAELKMLTAAAQQGKNVSVVRLAA